MDISSLRATLSHQPAAGFDFYERRPGEFQLIIPILHEDGDMVDIYLVDSPRGEGYVRVCDFGMALMRLSYTYEVNTAARIRILEGILHNSGVHNNGGNLYLDAPRGILYESILQFAGCVQKVCNMRYWGREQVRSAFYDDLAKCISTELAHFYPAANQSPLPEYPISVDWQLTHDRHRFYLFGVRGNDKAKNVAIALLEFQKERLPFISLVVHEDIDDLGHRERHHLTRNADRQYPALVDFEEKATADITRMAGAMN